jgi:hypothetical protein
MPTQKSIDYKETAVNYYLVEDKTQEEVCKIFNCIVLYSLYFVILLYLLYFLYFCNKSI